MAFNDILPEVEWALLEGQWGKSLASSATEFPNVSAISIARDVVEGKFYDVLTSPVAKGLFVISDCVVVNDADLAENLLRDTLQPRLLNKDLSVTDETENELIRLALGATCLRAFVQINWTGPDFPLDPSALLGLSSSSNASGNSESEKTLDDTLNRFAIAELAYGGEPAYHLAKSAVFLRIAQILFSYPYRHCQSYPWWNLRATLIHQHLLDDPVPLPLTFYASLDPLESALKGKPDLLGRFLLERGLVHHLFAQDKIAAEYFVRAARATELKYELSGALGKRTKFQVSDLTQLVLLAESRKREDDESTTEAKDGQEAAPSVDTKLPETLALNDDTLLEQTEFTSSSAAPGTLKEDLSHLDPASQPALHPLDQCILLSLCLNVRNTSPKHGLTSEQMSPYVARVISHPKNWSVHTMALLLRSRLEASRTRTVERSTLQLQALIDQMPTSDSTVTERLLYFDAIAIPSKWELEHELGMRFLSIGVVRSAMEIFERLEMWEEVVQCWQSLERPDKGIAIVKDLLEGKKEESEAVVQRNKAVVERSGQRVKLDIAREAKLWCLLGDLEPQSAEEHYKRAWEVSKKTSGRATRSLGGYYFTQHAYAESIVYLRQAVEIHPLLARTWFLLGCACVREERWDEARDAFTRCVSLDEEDGESWNNLASVYLHMPAAKPAANGDSDEEDAAETQEPSSNIASVPFANKMLAFRALKQGLKFSYENWRMWSNYMIVTMDVGELSEACRALGRVIEMRSEKDGAGSVDIEVLERLVGAVTRSEFSASNGDSTKNVNPNEGQALARRVADLFNRTILPRVSTSARIFRAHAQLLVWQRRWSNALEAHLNAYRCSVASDQKVETDLARWQEAVVEVEELVEVMRNLGARIEAGDGQDGPGIGGGDKGEGEESEGEGELRPKRKRTSWQFQARSIVRTFMGRTKASFEEEPEWEKLSVLVEELRAAQ